MERTPRKRRNFSEDFKQHVVDLYQEGMGRKEIIENMHSPLRRLIVGYNSTEKADPSKPSIL